MAETVAKQQAEARERSLMSRYAAEVIGGLSSIIATGSTARRLIRERSYKNLSSLYFIEDLKKERAGYGLTLVDEVKRGALNGTEAYPKLQNGVQKFQAKMDERLVKGGVNNVIREWGLLRSHQRWEVVVESLSAGGIALGAMLLLGREMFSREQEDALQAKGSGPTFP